jgi:hypothetical protein
MSAAMRPRRSCPVPTATANGETHAALLVTTGFAEDARPPRPLDAIAFPCRRCAPMLRLMAEARRR